MAKSKHSAEWKIALVEQYLSGGGSYDNLAHANGVGSTSLKRWVSQYRAHEVEGFIREAGNKHYSKEFKEQCVKAVLTGKGSVNDIVAKYNISDRSVLRRWIACYNANRGAPVRRVQFGWVKLLTRQSLASSRYLALEPKP